MVGTRTRFTSERAPCGKTVDGENFRDEDTQGLFIYEQYYSCGCRRTRQEYHDGSYHIVAVRHDGKVLMDEAGPVHGA